MEKSFQGHCGTLTSHSMGTGNRVEVPGLVPSPVGAGAGTGEGGWCWVSGVRNSPSAQLGWALGTLAEKKALLILREGGKEGNGQASAIPWGQWPSFFLSQFLPFF